MQIGGPAASLVDVTLFRIGTGSAAIEFVRITTGSCVPGRDRYGRGPVEDRRALPSPTSASSSLDVKVPAKGGVVSIVLNGATATDCSSSRRPCP